MHPDTIIPKQPNKPSWGKLIQKYIIILYTTGRHKHKFNKNLTTEHHQTVIFMSGGKLRQGITK